jgi:colanic acid biosynthesis glycosyl transferase WcaI
MEERNGVSVRRSYVHVPGTSSTLKRIMYDTSFTLSSFISSLFVPNIDAILCVSPPLQLGVTGYLLSKIKGARFFLQLVDLVPDAAIALGMLENKRAIRVARVLEKFAYQRAEQIIVICQGFSDNIIAKGVPREKVHVFSDWIDTAFVRPIDQGNDFRSLHDLDPRSFVVLYSGNLGVKQGLPTLVEAARRLRHHEDIVFLIVGDGMLKDFLVHQVAHEDLRNVRFLPVQRMDAVPSMLSAADVLALPQKAEVVDIVIPSKLLTYMAGGRPIVGSVHPQSEAGRVVRRAEAGLVTPPGDSSAFADAVLSLHRDRALAARLGANARRFAEQHFARDRVLSRYVEFFDGAERRSASRSAVGHQV